MSRQPRCLVLGGSGFAGQAICRFLSENGVRVVSTYCHHPEPVRQLQKEFPDISIFRLELGVPSESDERKLDSLLKETVVPEKLDALIVCVGTAGKDTLYSQSQESGWLKRITEDAWSQMMNVTAKSAFFAVKCAASYLNEGANIVLIGAINGAKMVPSPAHYSAAKGALSAMAQSLAKELGKRNIAINCIAPGLLDGGMGMLLNDSLREQYLKHSGLRRTCSAKELANVVGWFALENTYVNGQTVILDGGL